MRAITDIMTTMDYGPSPESSQPALDWLAARGARFGSWIGGTWRDGAPHFPSVNPATGKTLAEIAQARDADVDDAVQAATAALPAWSALGARGRSRVLYAIARTLQRHSRLLAVLETMDNGKPIRESRDIDVPLAVRHFYHHAGWALRLEAEFPHARALGVVGQIVPWNFPLLMLAWKIAPALACGNVVVFKPAEQTSLTALLFAELCGEAGVPEGVINIVTGDGAVGQAIARHPGIRKIAFTGSTEVGREIRKATAGSGKKLSLELGGKSPNIVFADADLDAAIEGIVDSIWFNQGQVCCAGSRLLVHEGTAERLLGKLSARMRTLRVGDPLDKSTDMGPLVDRTQWRRVSGYVERARAEGAEILQGDAGALAADENTCYFAPTLVTGVDTASEIVCDEVFGPVLVVQTFRTPAEAVELANHTRYGLAASLWTESIGLALDVAPKLEAGVVWINTANAFDASSGFGGVKESGFGREGGREGLIEYLAWDRASAPESTRPEGAGAARSERPAIDGAAAARSEWPATAELRPRAPDAIDRTGKLYIGGAQTRPDGGYSERVASGATTWPATPLGNRKDIRNAVEAARKAVGWERQSAHGRSQVLYYLAENTQANAERFVATLAAFEGEAAAREEVERTLDCLFEFAAAADKFEGRVHQPPLAGLVVALHEPIGVIGQLAPDDRPLLGIAAMLAPAIAMGNRVVLVPSQRLPWIAADWMQVLETSDVPGGVVNLVTGHREELAPVLAAHADVDAVWCLDAAPALVKTLEELSAGNLKRTWVEAASADEGWIAAASNDCDRFLRQATQIKNVWVPYGV
jgi:aldehyde dehydrogenase (NAD+)